MTDLSELSRAAVTSPEKPKRSSKKDLRNPIGTLGAPGSGTALARSWFAGFSKDPSNVELGGYITDAAHGGEAELQAFGETVQEALTAWLASAMHPLIDGNTDQSIYDLSAYAVFLTDTQANDPGDPGDTLQHGRYLAQRILSDGLEALKQRHARGRSHD